MLDVAALGTWAGEGDDPSWKWRKLPDTVGAICGANAFTVAWAAPPAVERLPHKGSRIPESAPGKVRLKRRGEEDVGSSAAGLPTHRAFRSRVTAGGTGCEDDFIRAVVLLNEPQGNMSSTRRRKVVTPRGLCISVRHGWSRPQVHRY